VPGAKTPYASSERITITTTHDTTYGIYALPTYCPRCRRNAIPKVLGKASIDIDEGSGEFVAGVPVGCPLCDKAYVAEYYGEPYSWREDEDYLEFLRTVPAAEPQVAVSDALAKVSPNFAKVYDEAVAAQVSGLEDLSAAGYRRALEFLVKDYLISRDPSQRETFERMPLARAIRDHIDDPDIREIARNATVIANDFVHAHRYSGREVTELRALINLVWRWIELREEIRVETARLAALNPGAKA
jgi:hypothetical protein